MKGSLSTLTSALLVLTVLTSIFTYISLELMRAPTQLAKINQEVLSQVITSSKDVEVVYDDGLYVRSLNPPLNIVSVLSVNSSGISTLLNNITVSSTYEKLLSKDVVDRLLLSKSYILIIAEGGKYFIVDDKIIKSINSSNTSTNAASNVNIHYLNSSNYLRPLIYVGVLKDLNQYMNNPVPGYPSDPEANYVPVGYALITGNSHTISKGDWYISVDPRSVPYKVGHIYCSGGTNVTYLGMGYYRVDSNHNVYVKWYESVSGYTSGWYISYETLMTGVAGLWVYPLVIYGNRSVDLVFEVKNLGSWVNVNLKPIIYVLNAEDFAKGLPIMPYHVNPTLEASIRYSAIKPLYTWEGNAQSASLSPNSTTSISISLNSTPILNTLRVGEALFLVGFRFASDRSLSMRLGAYILNYDIPIAINDNELGKYFVLPSAANVVPEVYLPNGSKLSVYRPINFASSMIDYPTLFTPGTSGTYVIRYRLGSYASLPEFRAQVSFVGNNPTPQVMYLRNQHLGGWSYVVNDSIVLEPNYAVLRDHEYFTAGSETWYSGDLMIVNDLPVNSQINFTYYITTSLQGVTALTSNQNRSVDYVYCWSSWSCYNYWRVRFTFYPNTTTTKLYVSGEVLYQSGAYYLRFSISTTLSDVTITATPYVSSIKYSYTSGNNLCVTYLATQFTELVRLNNSVLILAN